MQAKSFLSDKRGSVHLAFIRSQRITEEHNVDDQLAAMRQQMQISGPTAAPKA